MLHEGKILNWKQGRDGTAILPSLVPETCVAPRHVDASHNLFYFLLTSSVKGGDALPDIFFRSLFPIQQTTGGGIDHRVK